LEKSNMKVLIFSAGMMSNRATLISVLKKIKALLGMCKENKGMCTIICNALIAPQRAWRDVLMTKLNTKELAVTAVIVSSITSCYSVSKTDTVSVLS